METEKRVEAPTGEQVQGDPPAAPEPTPPAAAEPDYKAELASTKQQLDELKARSERLEAQLIGARGNSHQRQDWEMELRRTRQDFADVKEVIKALVEAQVDDQHPARKTLTAVEARSQEQQEKALVNDRLYEDWEDILTMVAKAEGKPLVTDADAQAVANLMKSDPAWRNVYAQAEEGFSKVNPRVLRKALHDARDTADEVKEKRHKADMAEAKNQAKKDAENMVHDEFIKRGLVETVNPKAAGVSPASLKGMIEKDPDSYTAEDLETLKSLASKG